MTEKRRRLLINIFLIISLLSFVGLSIAPLLTTALRDTEPTPVAQPSPETNLSEDRKTALENQVNGYNLVLEREPENQTALRGIIEAKLELGDIAGAIPALETLAGLNPSEPGYALLLAQAKQQVNDREGAAEAYRNLLTTNPGNLEALQGLVGLLLQENRPEAALGLLQDTLKVAEQANQENPQTIDVITVQLILGQVYAEQSRFDEAIQVYDDIAQQDAQDFRPLLAKAIVLRSQGKTDEAKPLLDSAAALAPSQYKDQINQLIQEISGPSPSAAPSPGVTPGATPDEGATPEDSPAEESSDITPEVAPPTE